MNDEPLEVIDKLKYLCLTLTKDRKSEIEINIRMTTETSELVRLITIWKSRSKSLQTQITLYKYIIFIYSTLSTLGCETWTLTERLEKKNYRILA